MKKTLKESEIGIYPRFTAEEDYKIKSQGKVVIQMEIAPNGLVLIETTEKENWAQHCDWCCQRGIRI